MTIDKAIELFESFIRNTNSSSEIKIHEDFIQILNDLKARNLSEDEIQAIAIELDNLRLNSNSEQRKKQIKKALRSFKEYLKTKFSLISKGYYTAIGMSLGMCFGVAFGALIEEQMGVSAGLSIGMFVGLIIGRNMDTQAEKEGRVLRSKF